MRRIAATLLICLTLLTFTGCTLLTAGGSGSTPSNGALTVDTAVSLVLTDYNTAVDLGFVKPNSFFDAAVNAYFKAEADLSAGKGTIVAINDALVTLAAETKKAKAKK